ncbi:hypothetical protein HY36_12520 [Hyphomonas atlantica]|uniref:Uncharacterized protein n=1 Tax=Hyphomonas atlantica TaxID=1280948 RepID=A0A059EAH1_9PROT|nr:hypothetical protein HY36_12520 [Hyphomonas atlantica]
MARLEDKTVLIPCGTTSIGFAAALLFLEEGARIAIRGRMSGGSKRPLVKSARA